MKTKVLILAAVFGLTAMANAQQLQDIKLNRPNLSRTPTMMRAFENRKSTRAFQVKELSLQDLSDLLWAANGYNRPAEKKRTAPTARNKQEIDVYVLTKNGAYIYDPAAHKLRHLLATDIREYAATQPFVKDAPVSLLIVSDMNRFGSKDPNSLNITAFDAGMVSQNISLFCSGAGLATVPRAGFDKAKLAELLGLDSDQILQLNHPVGYMK